MKRSPQKKKDDDLLGNCFAAPRRAINPDQTNFERCITMKLAELAAAEAALHRAARLGHQRARVPQLRCLDGGHSDCSSSFSSRLLNEIRQRLCRKPRRFQVRSARLLAGLAPSELRQWEF